MPPRQRYSKPDVIAGYRAWRVCTAASPASVEDISINPYIRALPGASAWLLIANDSLELGGHELGAVKLMQEPHCQVIAVPGFEGLEQLQPRAVGADSHIDVLGP